MFDIHTHTSGNENSVLNISYKNLSTLPRFFSFGIHPWDANEETIEEDIEMLRLAVRQHRPTFLGECGMDKVCEVPLNIQAKVFDLQVCIAKESALPLIIHCVKSSSEILSILRKREFSNPIIFHGIRFGIRSFAPLLKFSEGRDVYFSFGEHFCEETLRICPLEKILVESDTGNIQNARCNLQKILGIGIEKEIMENVERLFGKI